MINDRTVLALITARGGSKGLPGKNLRLLEGKPLIAWSIDAARGSRYVDRVVVSTDDAGIAEVARAHGASVPFLRPAALATDEASSFDVIEHALQHLAAGEETFDYLALLEPTSPLREVSDIDDSLERLMASGAEAIVSVCRADSVHPAFMYHMGETGALLPFLVSGERSTRRQDVAPLYFVEGTVYVSRVPSLLARRSFYHEGTIGYEVPRWKSPEVDDLLDFLCIETILRHRESLRDSERSP